MDAKLKKLKGGQHTIKLRKKVDLYDDIRDTIAELTGTLADMNTLTVDVHAKEGYQTLIDAVAARLGH